MTLPSWNTPEIWTDEKAISVTRLGLISNGLNWLRNMLHVASESKTISSNAITVTGNAGLVEVTTSGASDTLNTISGMAEGDVMMLKAASGKVIVIGTSGNIVPPGGLAFILPQTDFVTFIRLSSTIVPIGPLSLKRLVVFPVLDNLTLWTVKDNVGDIYFPILAEMSGMNLIVAHCSLGAVSSSGTPTMQISRYRGSWVDMLSTAVVVAINKLSSYETGGTAGVPNTSYDDIATGDLIRVRHTVTGTGTKGCNAIMVFALP